MNNKYQIGNKNYKCIDNYYRLNRILIKSARNGNDHRATWAINHGATKLASAYIEAMNNGHDKLSKSIDALIQLSISTNY